MKLFARLAVLCSLAALPFAGHAEEARPAAHPKVRLTTSAGVIELELDGMRAPVSVANFLRYVDRGFYDGTVFHRVIPGFMIQGGGFETGMKQKKTDEPIQNEADNGLRNVAGTVAMARTMEPHSASAQFFINTVDNPSLDHRDKSRQGWGYAVFGKVTRGMDVVKKIESVPTGRFGPFENVPREPVVIRKAERVAR
ncbi:cyclophilin [Sulfurifustis variabilis]|uniref:Peptidyl-prolyl cis-trans isomerase n=1 Tax=Sulfurifustis variabilis TaxID=1675686 RepID=A0A1B4V9E9_9GAMM|nr:peptidylprolyl isomerase [Sulfurifustis variabilis]BAU50179.1 cyclophilin [Sulfurifustis variabilis]